MTTDRERVLAANSWNYMEIGFLIKNMEATKSSLEVFETLGQEAADMIDTMITNLECLRSDYKMNEEETNS